MFLLNEPLNEQLKDIHYPAGRRYCLLRVPDFDAVFPFQQGQFQPGCGRSSCPFFFCSGYLDFRFLFGRSLPDENAKRQEILLEEFSSGRRHQRHGFGCLLLYFGSVFQDIA